MLVTALSQAQAQTFDDFVLLGAWSESVDAGFTCKPGDLRQQFELSADRKTLTFHNDEARAMSNGKVLKSYTATVLREERHALFIRYNKDVGGTEPGLEEWEMRFIGPSAYRWRATAWNPGRYNTVIGVRCK